MAEERKEERRPGRLTKHRRRSALLALMHGLRRGWYNRLGVSTDMVIFFDYDITSDICRRRYRAFVSEISTIAPAVEIKTERGYHVILCKVVLPTRRVIGVLAELKRRAVKPLTDEQITDWIEAVRRYAENNPEFFEGFYQWFKLTHPFYYEQGCVDPLHIDISIQRSYTTLRISGKEGKEYDLEFRGVWIKRRVYRVNIQEALRLIDQAGVPRPDLYKVFTEASSLLSIPDNRRWALWLAELVGRSLGLR